MSRVVWAWLTLLLAEGKSERVFQRDELNLRGDISITGVFPLHNTGAASSSGRPAVGTCNEGTENKHGYHLMQALRFAVEEINNSSEQQPLLPGVKLGYQIYDSCSLSANILSSVYLLKGLHQRATATGLDGASGSGSISDLEPSPVAVIGPDSSSKSFTHAALLGAYLLPQISYEASNEMLSNKKRYPSFFRTIPSDKNQVVAILELLVRFKWTWIALLGSDNAYGLQGMQSLSQRAANYDICIAYQAVIPRHTADTIQTMRNMSRDILKTNVNTIVLFSSKSKVMQFFPYVIERNVTGKVWLGTEDWIVSSSISEIPGIHTIGTVLGVSIKYAAISGFEEFERKIVEVSKQPGTQEFSHSPASQSVFCLQSVGVYTLARNNFSLDKYDVTSSFNVYKAVYTVAHALHQALGCDLEACKTRSIHPWQLMPWLKDVRFSLGNTSMYFDENGDPPTGYDIVTWVWKGIKWSVRTVGSFSPDPVTLTVDASQIDWSHSGNSTTVPLSICSPECSPGHKKLQTGHHKCCFNCLACPAATFLNKTGATSCQPCPPKKWAPARSEHCLNRTVLLLAWDAPLSTALLLLLAATLLLTSGSALVLLLNMHTPVAKSAGGRTCLVMLAALTAAAASTLCHFGPPTQLACVLKQPLFVSSINVCLACVAVRAFQVVCIFKFASKLPRTYDTWARNRGPEFTILLLSGPTLCVSALRVALYPPRPAHDLRFYSDSIVLECSNTLSPGSLVELACTLLLSALCFSLSYMGKDLPANYNEAKCVTFSLMVYMISWIGFFTLYLISRDPLTMAANVFAILSSVLGMFGGYFLPKVYIIMFRPQMNTSAHFQNCIQMYTMRKKL